MPNQSYLDKQDVNSIKSFSLGARSLLNILVLCFSVKFVDIRAIRV